MVMGPSQSDNHDTMKPGVYMYGALFILDDSQGNMVALKSRPGINDGKDVYSSMHMHNIRF